MIKRLLALLLVGMFVLTSCGDPEPDKDDAAPVTVSAPISPILPKIIGMSTEPGAYDDLLTRVGPDGVEARRIYFPDITADGRGAAFQNDLLMDTINSGQMPVISYKVKSISGLINGSYDAALDATREYLNGLGVQVTATFWHEPHGDMAPADFRAASQRFVDHMKAPNVAVGPILNGWLLDSATNTAKFETYMDNTLLTAWDFVAVDTYQDGTNASPGTKMPGRAVTLLAAMLDRKGFPDKPIGVGEYNGLTADTVKSAGEIMLSTPEVWFALLWSGVGNSSGTDWSMDDADVSAYKLTKDDNRAFKGC